MTVLAVYGSKGGVGTSLVAVNLGLQLARRTPTLLVDLVPGAGCCDLLLDISAERSWRELLPVAAELTERHLELSVVSHNSGLSLLASPPDQVAFDEKLDRLLDALAERWSWVVLDTGSGCATARESAFKAADRVLLVTTPDPPSLRAAARLVTAVEPEEGLAEPELVLNQLSPGHPVDPDRTAASLGIELLGEVPLDRTAVGQQVHFGRPPAASDESEFGAAIGGLTAELLGGHAEREVNKARTAEGAADGA